MGEFLFVDDLPEFIVPNQSFISQDEDGIHTFDGNQIDDALRRAEKYLNFSRENRINYLPHPERAKYIINQLEKHTPDRLEALNRVDKQLREFYIEIDDRLGGNGHFACSVPLLHRYIKEKAKSPQGQLEEALRLREDNNISEFRECLDMMDELLNKQQWIAYDEVIMHIDDLAKGIIDSYGRKSALGTLKVKLGVIPPKLKVETDALGFEVGLIPPKLEVEFKHKIKKPRSSRRKYEKKLHFTFLADMLDSELKRRV